MFASRTPVVLACVLILTPPGRAADSVVSGRLGARLDDYFRRLADFGFSGAVLVAKDGKPVLVKGYGLADREKKRPYTPDTVFSVGSISKQFTAAAILKLEMEGKLRVQDAIGKYLPNVPADKAAITVHHLLTHSAGLESDFGDDFDKVGRAELLRRVLTSKLRWRPGERFYYSNSGYSVLGAIVEIVSGQGYEVYLREHLFKPAGMTETGYRLAGWDKDRLAQGYAREGKIWGTIPGHGWAKDGPYWNLRANGGIHSTLGDMYRWPRALEGETVLSKPAKKKLFGRHMPEGGGQAFYGYGWSIRKTRRGTDLISHNGGNGIFAADFLRYVDDGVCVILASNSAEAPATRISGWVDRLLFGGAYPDPPRVVPVDSAWLRKYAGTYQLPSAGKLVCQVKGGALTLTADGPKGLSLLLSEGAGSSGRLKALSERTAAIVAAQLKKDYGPLYKAFGGRIPLERLRDIEARNRAALEGRRGVIRSFEVLGSAPAGEDVETYLRLNCGRGPATVCYIWHGQQLQGSRMVQELPASRAFLPRSETESASFRFDSPAVWSLRFATRDGAVTGLRVRFGGGEITATRIGA